MSTHEDRVYQYTMVIEWSERDRTFLVTIPDLSIRTHGATYEQAASQGRDAIDAWIDAAEQCGEPVPEPHWHLGSARAS